MKTMQRDYVAEAIADYDAMTPQNQGKLLVQVMEDQPYLMGFITNVADDFSDAQHEALVDATLILINAFIAAGLPFGIVPATLVEDVITEKTEQYEAREFSNEADKIEVSDSPRVFQDLRNRAVFKAGLAHAEAQAQYNFSLMLDVIITIIERKVDLQQQENEKALEA